MKNVIVDFRTAKKTTDTLSSMNYNVIKTPKLNNVCEQISGHTDIMLHVLNETTLVCEESVFDYFKDKLPDFNIIKGTARLSSGYPYDIAYNTARVGNNIFCCEKYTEKTILNFYYEHDFKIVNIKQGYAKCSICAVSDNAIITQDTGIYKAAGKNGIDALLIHDEGVRLDGFKNGFIGGASGLLDTHTLAFNGNINYHADCGKITDFCNKYNVNIISLNEDMLYDIGTVTVV